MLPAEDSVWIGTHARDGRDIHFSFTKGMDPSVPPALPADFIARCVGELTGEIAHKMSLADELAAMAKASADAGELALIDTVQRALFGAPLESLGLELPGAQAQTWQEIVRGVKGG